MRREKLAVEQFWKDWPNRLSEVAERERDALSDSTHEQHALMTSLASQRSVGTLFPLVYEALVLGHAYRSWRERDMINKALKAAYRG